MKYEITLTVKVEAKSLNDAEVIANKVIDTLGGPDKAEWSAIKRR